MAPKKKRNLWIWGGLSVLVLAVVLGVVMAARGSNAKLEPSQLAKVERGDIARSVVATGKVQPILKVEVKSKASGIVTKLYTDINAHVPPGQPPPPVPPTPGARPARAPWRRTRRPSRAS